MISEIHDKLATLLQGKIPDRIHVVSSSNEEESFAESMNKLIGYMEEIHEFIIPLSKGELDNIAPVQRSNFLAAPFKELHSRLQHLAWQAGQVAKGDYNQRVDFMGDFSEAFNFMIQALESKERDLRQKIAELEDALAHIKKLEGILPICANCKKIRLEGADPKNQEGWVGLQEYVEDQSGVTFTHSICPQCLEKLYPDIAKKLMKSKVEDSGE
jgi:hypothetical protein